VDAKLLRIQTYVKEQRSVLIVPEVSHEMHGEYSCSIQNIAGTATKVFNVYVEGMFIINNFLLEEVQ